MIRKNLKRIVAIALCAALVMGGCGKKEAPAPAVTEDQSTDYADDKTEDKEEAKDPAEDESRDSEPEKDTDGGQTMTVSGNNTAGVFTAKDVPDKPVFDLVRDMKVGFSLGNTFDAWGYKASSPNDIGCETYWQKAKTTRSMVEDIHNAGFQTLRLPVSWHDHIDANDKIHSGWLARVHEVVDWAIDEGMYVIINIHHDDQESFGCVYVDNAHYDRSKAYVEHIWTQLAEEFRDYDEHLIFESLNEPRLAGTDYEWNYVADAPECIEASECINKLNQVFVDTVRKSGGNNAKRFLMVPGYGGSVGGVCSDAFKMPTDPAGEDMIMLETHAYIPYAFALSDDMNAKSFSSENAEDRQVIDDSLEALYTKFVSNGIPVIMDEFGARDKDNIAARADFAGYYVAKARENGITCAWWDNNNFTGTGELFGIYDRAAGSFKFPEIVDAIMANCNTAGVEPLKAAYSDEFKIGVAVQAISHWNDRTAEIGNPDKERFIRDTFNSMTFGNELKPAYNFDPTSPTLFKIDRSAAELLAWAKGNRMPVRAHVLVWHSQVDVSIFAKDFKATENGKATKDWNAKLDEECLVDRDTLVERLKTYIYGAMEYVYANGYADTVYAWDVVNEAIDENGPDGYRESYWYKIIGPEFLYYSFLFAREAEVKYSQQYAADYGLDPKGDLSSIRGKLFYNDYNEWYEKRVETAIRFCSEDVFNKDRSMVKSDVIGKYAAQGGKTAPAGTILGDGLIDGIGLQGHLDSSESIERYMKAVRAYGEVFPELHVTELDVGEKGNLSTANGRKAAEYDQGKFYYDYFTGLMEEKRNGANITSVTLWGLTDDSSWRKDTAPLILRGNLTPKASYLAMVQAAKGIPMDIEVTETERDASDLVMDFEMKDGESLDIDLAEYGISSRGAGHQSVIKRNANENHTPDKKMGMSLSVVREAKDATVAIDIGRFIGNTVEIELYVKTKDATVMMGIDGGESVELARESSNGDWVLLKGRAELGEGLRSAAIYVETDGNAKMYIDDITVKAVK